MVRKQAYYTKRRPINETRVKAGKLQAEQQRINGRWGTDGTKRVRSSHLGYDCYAMGKIMGQGGRIRCLLRSTRVPSHITMEILPILPVEMLWPEKDHEGAHHMIDAVLTFDLKSLASWKSLYPAHEFGYEGFMELAQRHMTQQREKTANSAQMSARLTELTKVRQDPTLSPFLPTPPVFPAPLSYLEPMGEVELIDCTVVSEIARFKDGSAALRLTLRAPQIGDGKRPLLSRAYVDLLDGRFEIIEHYPGRYKALEIPPRRLLQVMGIRNPTQSLRKRTLPRPPSPGESVQDTSRRAQAAFITGDPNAAPAPAPVVEEADPDAEVTQFPSAPAGTW